MTGIAGLLESRKTLMIESREMMLGRYKKMYEECKFEISTLSDVIKSTIRDETVYVLQGISKISKEKGIFGKYIVELGGNPDKPESGCGRCEHCNCGENLNSGDYNSYPN